MHPFSQLADSYGYHCFRWQRDAAICGGTLRDFLFLYKVPHAAEKADLADAIELACRGPGVPDVICVFYAQQEGALVEEILRSNLFRAARARISTRIVFATAELDLANGVVATKLRDESFAHIKAELESILVSEADVWLDKGLHEIFDRAVVLEALPGFAYLKPSQSRSRYFLRAEQGLANSGAVAFVGLAAYRKLFRGVNVGTRVLRRIYVDTMGIAPAAYALRELLSLASAKVLPQVVSFHSYEGLDALAPVPGTSVFMLSASTSMSLHRRIAEQKRIPAADIVTLVTVDGVKEQDRALRALPTSFLPEEVPSTASYDIRIQGEHFVPGTDLPRLVLLREKIHGQPKLVSKFAAFAGLGVFDIQRASLATGKARTFFVDADRLILRPIFAEWLATLVRHRLKASTRRILCQDDAASVAMGSQIQSLISGLIGQQIPVVTVKRNADMSALGIDRLEGLVICAAAVGKGSTILNISRDLRGIHDGPRTYVIGFQVVEEARQLEALRTSLVFSSTNASIEFCRFGEVATGYGLAASLDAEASLLFSSSNRSDLPTLLQPRAAAIRGSKKIRGEKTLLPTAGDKPLLLRGDFAFWKDCVEYEPDKPIHAEVIGTMAALLQRARESQDLPPDERLGSPVLRQCLLSPENFTRFDDGVIQAALLRVAMDSELDYRADKQQSWYMRETIIRMIRNHANYHGEAMFEFLLALSIGRLKLVDTDLVAIRDAVSTLEGDAGAVGAWMVGAVG